jgi:four helix bundle protein
MKHNFKKLEIWIRSRNFVKEIYMVTQSFPKEEIFGLTCQLRRSAVAIPSNIAEGCGRSSNPQLVHFLDIAIGSSCETETQLYLSFDLGDINELEMK